MTTPKVKPGDVSRYIEAAPAGRHGVLTRLRKLCRDTLTGYEECIEYGMPGYKKNGKVEVAFASQKNYISLYILKHQVVIGHRDQLAGLSIGKGCIRYSKPEKMDFKVIESLLRATAETPEDPC
jgi:uncharacterized protein YdhG (YjbR/CyaY superfamily)